MAPKRDATNTIYAAGALLAVNGLMQLAKGNTTLGIASLILGPVLIIQRVLLVRKRIRSNGERRSNR
jgi:hypothetical protein